MMSSDERLDLILQKLELLDVLDDVVRGDKDRGMTGLQDMVRELENDIREVKKALERENAEKAGKERLLSAVGLKNVVQFVTTFGAVIILLISIWQAG